MRKEEQVRLEVHPGLGRLCVSPRFAEPEV